MNKKIKKIRFSSLWKVELPELADRLITIVEKHDPETLEIKATFDLLVGQKPQINLLEVPFGPHPITKKLKRLRKQRKAFASGINNRLKTIEKGGKTNAIEHLEVLQPVAIRFLSELSRANNKVTSQRVTQFLEQILMRPELSDATEALEMSSDIQDLQVVHANLGDEYDKRTQSNSVRPKGMTSTYVNSVITAINNMFKDIELAQVKNPALDYNPLVDELNEELVSFGKLINARASYNKRKAEEALKNNEVVDDEVIVESKSEEPLESTQSTERIKPMNVEVDNEENLDQLDIKKTAAVSTKQTRLPIVSPEA